MKPQPGAPVDGKPSLILTPELSLQIFSCLSLEKQAALLNKLPELTPQ